MPEIATFTLSETTLAKIDALFTKFPDKRSLTLPVCHLVQEEKGYLSDEAMEWIAQKLDLTAIQVLEVVSFYPMYRREPIGKVHVKVCRTLSCALVGAYKTCEQLEEQLNCKQGETSPDGKYTIEFVECIAKCGMGPLVQVDDKLYENCKPDQLDGLIADIQQIAEQDTPADIKPEPGTPAYNG
ncbi:MAG: NADH-quinone oxidoreductase subunit NuoE [Verrucomicrobiota bacterium]